VAVRLTLRPLLGQQTPRLEIRAKQATTAVWISVLPTREFHRQHGGLAPVFEYGPGCLPKISQRMEKTRAISFEKKCIEQHDIEKKPQKNQ